MNSVDEKKKKDKGKEKERINIKWTKFENRFLSDKDYIAEIIEFRGNESIFIFYCEYDKDKKEYILNGFIGGIIYGDEDTYLYLNYELEKKVISLYIIEIVLFGCQ